MIASQSILITLKKNISYLRYVDINPYPGSILSLTLGIAALFLLICILIYSLRRNIPSLRNKGDLNNWLDFHIFCGILGPILVLFHSNFKVGGLIALGFWSMVISVLSGIIGRYFFLQVNQEASYWHHLTRHYEGIFVKIQEQFKISNSLLQSLKIRATEVAGGPIPNRPAPTPMQALFKSVYCDLRLLLSTPNMHGLPPKVADIFIQYGLATRKIYLLEQYRKLMGYWKTFHLPFAVIMYLVIFIHVATYFFFGVKR
jgi:hypothetical protein